MAKSKEEVDSAHFEKTSNGLPALDESMKLDCIGKIRYLVLELCYDSVVVLVRRGHLLKSGNVLKPRYGSQC